MIRRLVQLILDQAAARKLEKEVDRSMKKVARESESTFSKAFKRIAVAIGAALSVRAIVGFTKEMFRLGSAAEETASKFRTVFGEERAAELDTFLGRFEHLAGFTRSAGRDMLANFGAVFQGAGLAADASATLSEQALKLAGDFQSFHDVPIAETFAAIRSGATGETEPLKRFGIVLRAAEVDMRALANTGKTTTKELTEQERVVARMQLIVEKAGKAVGDLERTQDSAANRARQLNGRLERMRETVAVGMLPALELLIPVFEQLAAKAEVFANKTAGVVQALLDLAGVVNQEVAIEIASITQQLHKMDEAQRQAFLTSRLVRAAADYQELARRVREAQQGMFDATPAFERVGKSVEDMTNRAIRGMQEQMQQAGAVMNFISGQLAGGEARAGDAEAGGGGGGEESASLAASVTDVSEALLRVGADASETAAIVEILARGGEEAAFAFGAVNHTAGLTVEVLDSAGQSALVYSAAVNGAANAQDRLNAALQKAQGLLGVVSRFASIFGFAIPGLSHAGGILSLFSGLFKSGEKKTPGVGVPIPGFSGLYADGGRIPVGNWGIVGERGPEIVTGPATVTPMRAARIEVHVGPARDPVSFARDADWQRAIAETNRELSTNGFRFE